MKGNLKNNVNSPIRGFSCLSKAWYGNDFSYLPYEDCVTFGYYYKDGSTSGEMSFIWDKIDDKLVPHLEIYSDAWSMLSKCHDLIDLLGNYNNNDLTVEEFIQILSKCGFKDLTRKNKR